MQQSLKAQQIGRATLAVVSLFGSAALAVSCAAGGQPTSSDEPTTTSTKGSPVRLPERGAGFDYQLGGAYPPRTGVTVVERDRTDRPAGAGYDICYVNGFQTQPAESQGFARLHPELVVRANGVPIVDPGWPDEYVFDTSTEAKRTALVAIVEPWIEGCKAAGFAAVEIDNLDSYTRVGDALTAEDNIAMATMFAEIAHRHGLSIAQKNTADQTDRLRRAGYDFAITESCVAHRECGDYTAHYPVVLDVEYTDELDTAAFASACSGADRAPVMIMRDHDLTTPRDPGYRYLSCTS